jgi:glycosyltransferase involved in cell wall biosynthesis
MKIKVLHVIHSLSGGGAETQSQLLANGLLDYNVKSVFFCINSENHHLKDDSSIYEFPRKSKYDFRIYLQLSKVIAQERPDVIHAWLPAAVTLPAMLLGKLKSIPTIFSYRNRMFFHRPISWPEFLIALLCSKKIVSNNLIEQSIPAFRWLYARKSGEVIYNAVSSPSHDEMNRIRQNPTTFRFLFLGRLTQQKNIPFLLNSLSKLNSDVSWQLDIYGIGELEGEIRSKVDELGLAKKVTLKGYCLSVYQAMSEADALLFPSLYEGMPNVLVEAMACGIPIFASDIVSSRDVVKDSDAVTWFEPTNEAELIYSLEDFVANSHCYKEKTINGIERAREFSIANLAKKYRDVYRSVL